jgi:hypothetical protein
MVYTLHSLAERKHVLGLWSLILEGLDPTVTIARKHVFYYANS